MLEFAKKSEKQTGRTVFGQERLEMESGKVFHAPLNSPSRLSAEKFLIHHEAAVSAESFNIFFHLLWQVKLP